MNNPFAVIFLCAVLITPVITLFLCLLFNMNLGGSLINTAALFVFNIAGVILVYIFLFVGLHFFDKKFRKYY